MDFSFCKWPCSFGGTLTFFVSLYHTRKKRQVGDCPWQSPQWEGIACPPLHRQHCSERAKNHTASIYLPVSNIHHFFPFCLWLTERRQRDLLQIAVTFWLARRERKLTRTRVLKMTKHKKDGKKVALPPPGCNVQSFWNNVMVPVENIWFPKIGGRQNVVPDSKLWVLHSLTLGG